MNPFSNLLHSGFRQLAYYPPNWEEPEWVSPIHSISLTSSGIVVLTGKGNVYIHTQDWWPARFGNSTAVVDSQHQMCRYVFIY